MIKVRPALKSDAGWIFAMCEDFARFYDSKISLAGNPEHGRRFLDQLISQHVVLVAVNEQEPMGFIAGLMTAHHFNPDIIQLAELLWWVPEEHRNTRAGAMLFSEFLKVGEEYCQWVTFTLETKSPVKDSFLLKRGFKLTERAYLKEC